MRLTRRLVNSNATDPRHYVATVVLLAGGLALISLPVWNITGELSDPKRLVALVILPLCVFLGARRRRAEHAGVPVCIAGWNRPALLAVALFATYTLINWYVLGYPYYGTRGLVHYWIRILAFLVGYFFLTRTSIQKTFPLAVVAVGLLSTLYLFLEYFGIATGYGKNAGLSGLTCSANIYGFLMIPGILWSVYLVSASPTWSVRLGVLIALLLQFAGLLTSKSRGSIALVALGLAATVYAAARAKGKGGSLGTRLAVYGVALVTGVLLVCNDQILREYATLLTDGFSRGAVRTRMAIFQAQTGLFLEHPLFGGGVGNFIHLSVAHWPQVLRDIIEPFTLFRSGHNDYLETLAELGLVGGLFHLFFLFGAIGLGIASIRKPFNLFGFLLVVQLSLMAIHSSFSVASRHLPASLLLWSTAGLLWGNRGEGSAGHFPAKLFRGVGLVGVFVHVLVFGLFAQLLMSDFFYLKAIKHNSLREKADNALLTALSIHRHNPPALYEMAYRATTTGEYEYALKTVEHLDSVAPSYRPTNFVRGLIHFRLGNPEMALAYARKAVSRIPNHVEAQRVRALSLAALERCNQLQGLQDSLRPSATELQLWLEKTKTMTEEEFESSLRKGTPFLKRAIGGNALRQRRKDMLRRRIADRAGRYEQLRRILAIPCPLDSSTAADPAGDTPEEPGVASVAPRKHD